MDVWLCLIFSSQTEDAESGGFHCGRVHEVKAVRKKCEKTVL